MCFTRFAKRAIIVCVSLFLSICAAAPEFVAAANPHTLQSQTAVFLFPNLTGAFIELHAHPIKQEMWTRIQWQDAFGGWQEIEGWQGAFNPDQRVLWYVGEEHLGDGPFRWLVYESQGGDLLTVSQPFNLPLRSGEVLYIELSLPALDKAGTAVTSLPAPPITTSLPAPWLRAHPVWDSVDGWNWPQDAVLHLTIDNPATDAAPDFEMEMPGKVDPALGSVWFDFAGVYDLKPGDEVTLSDGTTTRQLVVSILTINAVDVSNETVFGTAVPGTSIRLPAPPPPDNALFVTADSSGTWSADFHDIGFNLAYGTMVIAEVHDEEGDLTSFEWEIPPYAPLGENVAAARPVTVTTNGANDDRENPGMEPADVTDGRLDYLPAGDAQEDGVVGYVNDDFNQPMVITVTIDLEGFYDISSIRYTTGDIDRADTWNADLMTTIFGSTPTNPGTPGEVAWTEHTGSATLSSVTIVLEKMRVSFETDWLFIGEIQVYGVPSESFIVYESDFDDLALRRTLSFPGTAGHDEWFQELAQAPGYGEIQDRIALSGQSLHEFTSSAVDGLFQTIDKRLITPPDLLQYPLITLQVDFYAHSNNLDARNVYDAFMVVNGGPHPGYEIIGFGLASGNGVPRSEAGVNIVLNSFNGVDNNIPILSTIGQQLAWEKWHHVILVVDQTQDRYVSLTVNGQMEDLSAYALPRSELDGVWSRGQLMEAIIANIAPHVEFGDASEDDVYWDNLLILVGPAE